jgi:hypothetical protein
MQQQQQKQIPWLSVSKGSISTEGPTLIVEVGANLCG